MATRATSSEVSDEILFHNDGVSLCLLVNRRQRSLRIVDFRSGPHPAKRVFVMSLARRENVERVYTLVERDECSTWTRLGFHREGTIPGFYKRSDAFLLGALVPGHTNDDVEESGLRPALNADGASPDAERKYQAARKVAKDREDAPVPPVKVQLARPADVKKALAAAQRSGRALTTFESFGRDVERLYYSCTARGGFSLSISVETQPCFNNAFIELLTAPRTEKEAILTSAALRKLCDDLFERGIVGCFGLTPSSDLDLGAAYLNNGFRRTGTLAKHMLLKNRRVDALLWSRKLAQPADA